MGVPASDGRRDRADDAGSGREPAGRPGAALALATDLPPERIAEILHARAIRLAEPLGASTAGQIVDLVVFRFGDTRYAIESAETEAVLQAVPTPLPGVPPFYLGVISHRGAVCPLLDIAPLLGRARSERSGTDHAIVCPVPGGAVALAADAIEGLVRYEAGDLSPVTDQGGEHSAIRGMTQDGAILIDAATLLQDARLIIDDQPLVYSGPNRKDEKDHAASVQ